MSQMFHRELVAQKAIVHDQLPNAPRVFFDQSFELPGVLYGASLGLFAAFLGVMIFGFGNPGLIIPMAICAIFLAGFYGIPALFIRQAPAASPAAMSWGRFKAHGVRTMTGHLPAGEAAIQMLILPVLILFWGTACVAIAALV